MLRTHGSWNYKKRQKHLFPQGQTQRDHSISDLSALMLKGNLPSTFKRQAWEIKFISLLDTKNYGLTDELSNKINLTLWTHPAACFSLIAHFILGGLLQHVYVFMLNNLSHLVFSCDTLVIFSRPDKEFGGVQKLVPSTSRSWSNRCYLPHLP